MSSKASTTIGFERRFNHALQGELADFISAALGPPPPRPPNMERIVELNRGPFIGAQPPLARVGEAPDDAIELLDVREADERDEGHIPGSRHLPYRTARAAAEAGLLDGRPVVTICESGPRAAIAASVLQAAGIDARPVLDGGTATWRG